MTRRELWASAFAIFIVALVVRLIAAVFVPFPIPEDTAYYHGVARNLLEGRGLVTDALWNYQGGNLGLPPRPAFEIWMPLPTFLGAIPMALFGHAYGVAQLAAVLVGALVPVLAWRLALDVGTERGLPLGRRRVLALGAGLTAAVELPLVLHSTLLDSTAPFAVLVLLACLLMTRILDRPAAETWRDAARDVRLLGLGIALGLAALTRNEAIWPAATWFGLVVLAARHDRSWARAVRLVAVPAIVAIGLFAPWAIRNLLVLGSPLPSQTITNALSVTGFDIFAYQDPPTLSGYLALGAARLIELRVTGLVHNLTTVLLVPSFPVGIIGILTLPWFGRGRALQPLLIVSVVTLAFTTLVFPVSTTWGTYLHAAGATHVLLVVSSLFALDALIIRIGQKRGWTRPVAWLGPALTVAGAILFSAVFVPAFGRQSRDVATRYDVLPAATAAAGLPAVDRMGPVISDHPIWWAEAVRKPALGLPDEPPSSILALARAFPGTRYLVISSEAHGRWPGVLDTPGPDTNCFHEVHLETPSDPAARAALAGTRVFELVCP